MKKWQKDDFGKIYRTNNGKRYYIDEEGKKMDNVWGITLASRSKERTGYPTQKPLTLLRRIIEASSNEGDVVFDPFCGCATKMVAAQQLERNWIGIDIESKASELVVERLSDDAGLFTDFIHADKPVQRTDIKVVWPDKREVKDRIYKEQEGLCNACMVKMELRNLEVDHIVPKSKGGQNTYENYQLLCGHCNRSKGDKPMEYLMAKINTRLSKMQYVSFTGN